LGRKKLIEKLLEVIDDEEDDDKVYLVIYDFAWNKRPGKEFYRNLNQLNLTFVNKSCVLIRGKKHAIAVKLLAKHYGADVHAYRVVEEL